MQRIEKPFINSDGYTEAVVFLFSDTKTNRYLLEFRTESNPPTPFVPNGKVDEADREKNRDDYLVTAMEREIEEEFGSKVRPVETKYLGFYREDAIKTDFYIYLITTWVGKFPKVSYENGEVAAELKWLSLEEARQVITYPVLSYIFNLVNKK